MKKLLIAPSGSARPESKAYIEHFGLEAYPKKNPGLLYNLLDDPRQSKNLYRQYPEKVTAMRELLKRYVGGERCAPERE